jgi:hypothetical protein
VRPRVQTPVSPKNEEKKQKQKQKTKAKEEKKNEPRSSFVLLSSV